MLWCVMISWRPMELSPTAPKPPQGLLSPPSPAPCSQPSLLTASQHRPSPTAYAYSKPSVPPGSSSETPGSPSRLSGSPQLKIFSFLSVLFTLENGDLAQSLCPQNMCSPAKAPRRQRARNQGVPRAHERVEQRDPAPIPWRTVLWARARPGGCDHPLGTPSRGLPGAPIPASTNLALRQSPQLLIHRGCSCARGGQLSLSSGSWPSTARPWKSPASPHPSRVGCLPTAISEPEGWPL